MTHLAHKRAWQLQMTQNIPRVTNRCEILQGADTARLEIIKTAAVAAVGSWCGHIDSIAALNVRALG